MCGTSEGSSCSKGSTEDGQKGGLAWLGFSFLKIYHGGGHMIIPTYAFWRRTSPQYTDLLDDSMLRGT